MSTIRQDLTRTTLAIIFILLLIAASLWVLRPFLAATVWATMLVVATWPLLKSLARGRLMESSIHLVDTVDQVLALLA